jgi:hypothetical protein
LTIVISGQAEETGKGVNLMRACRCSLLPTEYNLSGWKKRELVAI